MHSKKLLIWGAGKIGRGFIADLFNAGGYEITFVDADKEMIKALNNNKAYTVLKYKNAVDKVETKITNYKALHLDEKSKIYAELMETQLMAIAVFPGAFENIAQTLTAAIEKRIESKIFEPLDIILCANILNSSKRFSDILLKKLNTEQQEYFKKYIGLIDSLVIRMAVEPEEDMVKNDPLIVLTNGYPELTIDKDGFKGNPIEFEGIVLTQNIEAEEMRKMYTYNMVHALYAYLGFQKNYEYVIDCTKDLGLQSHAMGALEEIGEALIKEYGFSPDNMKVWNSNVIENMANPILMDKVSRIGSDPIRKLKKDDRLTGPALLCKKNGIMPFFITKAIAFAFLFRDKDDAASKKVNEFANYYGIKEAAKKYCGLEKEPELLQLISQHYEKAVNNPVQIEENIEKINLMKKAYKLGFMNEKVFMGCAQCTLLSMFELTNKFNDSNDLLFQSASGLSGGMALSGDGVCGGYSGGVMYMGSLVGRRLKEMKENGDKKAQYISYLTAQKLQEKFKNTYDSVICSDIHEEIFGKSYCLRTKAIREEFEEAGAHTDKCTTVIGYVCAWIAEILYDQEKEAGL